MNKALISLGSNIEPEKNLVRAVSILRNEIDCIKLSSVIETISDGTAGPNFLNAGAEIQTFLTDEKLKEEILRKIESKLGRIRTQNKNAPRTIDMDIVIFNGKVIDPKIWSRIYLAIPLSELLPDFINPESGQTLFQAALELKERSYWKARPDMVLLPG
jgi:2-amino-4-hydroxy-6-hydroxymethyldihydropteridine diphosphokinase